LPFEHIFGEKAEDSNSASLVANATIQTNSLLKEDPIAYGIRSAFNQYHKIYCPLQLTQESIKQQVLLQLLIYKMFSTLPFSILFSHRSVNYQLFLAQLHRNYTGFYATKVSVNLATDLTP
jgi:hypothetical protein